MRRFHPVFQCNILTKRTISLNVVGQGHSRVTDGLSPFLFLFLFLFLLAPLSLPLSLLTLSLRPCLPLLSLRRPIGPSRMSWYLPFLPWPFTFSFSSLGTSALEDIYFATNGWNWKNKRLWMNGDPCEKNWHGVDCDHTGSTVTNLWVRKRKRKGEGEGERGRKFVLSLLCVQKPPLE